MRAASKAEEKKWFLVRQRIAGHTEFSSSDLARSYGLSLENIRYILKNAGVKDNG